MFACTFMHVESENAISPDIIDPHFNHPFLVVLLYAEQCLQCTTISEQYQSILLNQMFFFDYPS